MKKFYNETTDETVTIPEEYLSGCRYGLTCMHLHELGFKEVRENKSSLDSLNEKIKLVMKCHNCTIDQALSIVKFAQEN